MPQSAASPRPRVVVVGTGFGGLEAARRLARSPVDVTVIDRHNYHLFQPLLYQVATAALSRADIAEPIRVVLRYQQNATVLLDEVVGVDRDHLVEQYGGVLLVAQHDPDRFGNIGWRQCSGRDLVKERLEEVIIAAAYCSPLKRPRP